MTFKQIKGNEVVVRALSGMVDSGRVPHAIMLHEDDGGGALAIAIAFLQYLYCHSHADGDSCGSCASCNKIAKMIHPDVHFIFPTTTQLTSDSYLRQWRELALANPSFTEAELGQALGIEGKITLIAVAEAKAILDKLSLSALEGGYRSVLIFLPEKMNQEAANRLLKLIEEPPALTQFLLITHAPEKVLQTISSRCQHIRVLPDRKLQSMLAAGEDAYGEIFAQLMDALLSRNLLLALESGESAAGLPSRESAGRFCAYVSERLRCIFLLQQGMSGLCDGSGLEARWAGKCSRTFPRLALKAVDRANLQISRNVNLKLLFTEMVNQMYKIL